MRRRSRLMAAGPRGGVRTAAWSLAIVLLGMAAGGSVRAAGAEPEQLEIAGLHVTAWIPERSTPGPWPVIIFSHGFHGCAKQSTFLTTALAQAGYAVFAPNHRDAACANLAAWLERPEMRFGDPQQWNADTYADRVQDIEKLLDALHGDPRFSGPPFDWEHVGLIGHSLGGYTVLDAAGAWGHGGDPRVKAVLALSPYAHPFSVHKTLPALRVPVMYQTGTRDLGVAPFIGRAGGAFDQTPPPAYLVEFDGAGHGAWTDFRGTDHEEVIAYSRAFLDDYLKGRTFPESLSQPHRGVTVIKIKRSS